MSKPSLQRSNTAHLTTQDLLQADHSNREHLRVFGDIVNAPHNDDSEMISAVPDWAPIKERIRKSRKQSADVVREGWAYHLARWPLLILIGLAVFLEFLAYVLVRQLVNVIEYLWAYRGQRGRLRRRLQEAPTYDEWQKAALRMDDHLGMSAWKRSAPNAYYDHSIIRRVRHELRDLRNRGDVDGVATVLDLCCRSNFAGSENYQLYSDTYLGSKDNLETYYDEVERSLRYIRMTAEMAVEQKQTFFRNLSKGYGSTALCLSGGASFGYKHFGVIKALLDADLLPRIITGTSAGSLVASLACTYTDDELRKLLKVDLAQRIDACSEPMTTWLLRWWRTGARFDGEAWAEKCMFFTHGSLTFKEAFERTGRILNISVIPYATHSPTKLLNYLTAPDCVIFSAVLASAAVPGLLPPVTLLKKKKDGSVEPWSFAGRHKDGSLRVDIPLDALHSMFNCSFSIVSQVNPHILLLSFKPRGAPGRPVSHRGGRGWRGGFFLTACERFLKIEMMKNFQVIRDLELLPDFAGQNWSQVFLQKYDGTITVHPKSRIIDWFRLLSDPDETELGKMMEQGKRAIWPRMRMISNRLRIENQIDGGRADIKKLVKQGAAAAMYSPLPTDLDSDPLDEASDLDLGPPTDAETPYHESAPTNDLPATQHLIPPAASPSRLSTAPTNKAGLGFKQRKKEIMKKLGLGKTGQALQQTDDDLSDASSTAPLRPWSSAPVIRRQPSGSRKTWRNGGDTDSDAAAPVKSARHIFAQ